MLIPSWEQTSERAQPEVAGSHSNSNLSRKGVCTHRLWSVSSSQGWDSPGLSWARHLSKKSGLFLSVHRGHLADLRAPKMRGLTNK